MDQEQEDLTTTRATFLEATLGTSALPLKFMEYSILFLDSSECGSSYFNLLSYFKIHFICFPPEIDFQHKDETLCTSPSSQHTLGRVWMDKHLSGLNVPILSISHSRITNWFSTCTIKLGYNLFKCSLPSSNSFS